MFLASIEIVLIKKLRASNCLATKQYKKAVKGTVILLPLLGIIFIVFITPPGEDETVHTVFIYINAVLQSTQVRIIIYFKYYSIIFNDAFTEALQI